MATADGVPEAELESASATILVILLIAYLLGVFN
jgi:hypothetical protein